MDEPASGGTGQAPNLEEKHLLVVAHSYNNFVKEQVDELVSEVDRVTVLVRYNVFLDLFSKLPISYFDGYATEHRITSAPEGVAVRPTPLFYLPVDAWRRHLGTQHYRKIRDFVTEVVQPDLIHAHFTWTAGYAGVRLAEELDVPSVLTVHENRSTLESELQSDNDQIHWTWRNADTVIRVNEKDVPRLERYNDDVRAIPNGYSNSRYEHYEKAEARRELGLPTDAPIVFSLGALVERKGHHVLVEAMEQVVDEVEGVRCYIGGTGIRERHLRKQIENSSASDRIEFLGFVPEDDLSKWMHAADVFALPSFAEGNPTVMFEALGCGRPYIGSNVGGVDEIITDELGRYCEPGDPDALAEILVEGLNRDWDEEAIRRHAKRYRWSEISEQVADVYRSVLADTESVRAERPGGVRNTD